MPSEENETLSFNYQNKETRPITKTKQKPINMTFRSYLSQSLRESTVEAYQRVIDHFLLHHKSKKRITYSDIIQYLEEYNKRSARDLSAIKHYFDYLIFTEEIDTHPCKQLTVRVKKQYIQFQELFTKEELETLMDRPSRYEILRQRNKLMISLLIYQGLAPANITNLTIKDIDFDNGTIYIASTGKLSRRTLELKSSQVLLAYRYLNEDRNKLNPKDDKLFIGKLGESIGVDGLNRMLRPLKRLFKGGNLNAKTVRQSVISNWLNVEGIPIEDVQLISGIKWLSSLERYRKEDLQQKVEMINRFFPV